MESLKLCIGMLLLLAVRADSQICPALEGGGITLTCTVVFRSGSFRQFYWSKRVNGASSIVAVCDPDNGSCAPYPSTLPYTCKVTNINASSATSNITILSTARTDQGSWFCSGSSLTQDASACDLKVFATPTSVSRSLPELHNDNVIVTCTGDRVYPQPLCQFTWTKNGNEQSTYNVAVKNQTLSQSQNTDYFYPECTWTIPVQTLGFGSHQFNALIYPNVTGNTATDMSYGRNSSLTPSIAINYICKAEVLGAWSNKTFNPDVAYGPDQVVMKVRMNGVDNAVIDLCSKAPTSQTMTVSCTVPDVRPNTTIRYFINGNDQIVGSAGSVDYPVTGGGTLPVKCTASNTIFPEIYNETTRSLLVREPPNTPFLKTDQLNLISSTTKVFQAEPGNDQQLTVREGFVRIWCRVDGGYPNVTNLTLNCIGSSTSGPDAISVEMNVTRKMNSLPCSCTATHSSACYVNNSATSTLNVLYPPAITNFTVTGAVNQEVQDNTNVMFSCEAEGNPAPFLTLLRDSDSQILGKTDSNNKAILQLNKAMACQDSGIYVCKAQSQGDEGEETMEIYVLCKQQLAPSEIQNRVYSIQANQIFNIYITVFGYPEPHLSLQSSTTLQKNAFSLTYYTTTPGNGVINFKIYTLLEAYFQKYELNITNTQGSFVYSFEIKKESAEDNVAAIVGGIIAGIVVIVLVAVVVYIARRRGMYNKCIKKESAAVHRYTVGDYEEKDPHYMNTDQPSSPYECIDDNPPDTADIAYMNNVPNKDAADVSYMNQVPTKDTQKYSPYEEVRTVQDNSRRSVTTNMREAQPYSAYIEPEDETPGSAEISDYVNKRHQVSHAGNRDYVNQEHQMSNAGNRDYVNQEHQMSNAGSRDYVNQEHPVSDSGVLQYENFIPAL